MPAPQFIASLVLVSASVFASVAMCQPPQRAALARIPRRVPPPGIEVPTDTLRKLSDRQTQLSRRLADLSPAPLAADVDCLLKAVRLAVLHGEFYEPEHVQWATQLLELAEDRLDAIASNQSPWRTARGFVVRGFRSQVDGSSQPYGLEIPPSLNLNRPVPLIVWLHGRGEKTTDLHFLHQRLHRSDKIQTDRAIVLHPFGRQCLGYKSAGETDVLEAVQHVQREYPIDADRIVLMGFSMGGAGAWHLGAHYADRWVAVSPGAGFAETAQYNRLQPDEFPNRFEQQLWGLYDVPAYTLNLFNLPVIAYSGEHDRQIQAARVMEQAFAAEGRQLTHLIGPGMAHKYHPETLNEIMNRLFQAVKTGRNRQPTHVQLQTRTLRYSSMFWVHVSRLHEHWQDTRVDAVYQAEQRIVNVRCKNVAELKLRLDQPIQTIVIDGQPLRQIPNERPVVVHRQPDATWHVGAYPTDGRLAKRPGLQGPIDDAFLDSFMVVLPSQSTLNPPLQNWIDAEVDHLRSRWRALFRGDVRMKRDSAVTDEDIQNHHLILWGTPQTNSWISRILKQLPIQWNLQQVSLGSSRPSFDAATHVPLMIYPNPLNRQRYVVLNSGPTFREGHDRTNSLQNPKLPDWAVLDIRQPPNALTAGNVVDSGFFDESWQVQASDGQLTPSED